jgi:hypothetical protein
MDNFWELSDGDDITKQTGSFEVGGGELEPIPNDTTCVAIVDEAKWDADRDGNHFISLRWSVVLPAEYKNRKVFQKLWVLDDDPRAKDAAKKRDKAKRMLAAVDQNSGGKLLASGKRPSDEALGFHLVNKPMQIKVMEWKIDKEDGTTGKGNWIAAVAPRSGGKTVMKAANAPKAAIDEDDEAPF